MYSQVSCKKRTDEGFERCLTKLRFVATFLTVSEAMLIVHSLGGSPGSPSVGLSLGAVASGLDACCLRFSFLFWTGLPVTKKRPQEQGQ